MTTPTDDAKSVLDRFQRYPLLTIDEIRKSIGPYLTYLRKNRNLLIETGYGRQQFDQPLPEPFGNLADLYYIKLPATPSGDDFAQVIHFDDHDPSHFRTGVESLEQEDLNTLKNQFEESDRIRTEVEYDAQYPGEWGDLSEKESPLVFVRGITPHDAIQMERLRQSVYHLKLRFTESVDEALGKNTNKALWANCLLPFLADELLFDDVDFLLRMDRLYTGFDVRTGRIEDEDRWLDPGGLSALINIVGYCEKELELGTAEQLRILKKETKHEFYVPGIPELYNTSAFLEWCLTKKEGPYEEIRSLLVKDQEFYREFEERVNVDLENELREERFGIKVQRKHSEKFVTWSRLFLEWVNKNLELTGGLPDVTVGLDAHQQPKTLSSGNEATNQGCTTADNQFVRNVHGTWDLIYNDKAYRGLKHQKGFEYIRELLREPGKTSSSQELWAIVHLTGEDTTRLSNLDENLSHTTTLTPPEGVDAETVRRYKRELEHLSEQIEDAREVENVDKVAQLEEQRDAIAKELYSASKKRDPVAKRKQDAARKAIARAIAFLSEHAPEIGAHLQDTLQFGRENCYKPLNGQEWHV